MKRAEWCLLVALFLGVHAERAQAQPAAGAPSAEQQAEAKRAFSAGVALLQDPDGAKYEEARLQFKRAYELTHSWKVLGNLGLVAFAEEDYPQALAYQQQALAGWRSVNNKPWLARGVEHFALIAAATGDGMRAARFFGAAAALREAFGTSQQPNDRELNERYIAMARERVGEPVFSGAWEEGGRMSLEEALMKALGEDCRPSSSRTGRRNDDKVARARTSWEERG